MVDANKRADQTRQGLGALCVCAALLLVGFAVGGDVGHVLRAAGLLGAALALAVVAYTFTRRRD